MDKGITDNELLIIRHIKRNNPNRNILKRLVARYWLIHYSHVDENTILYCLINIIEKFDLFLHYEKDNSYSGFYLEKEPFIKSSGCLRTDLIEKAASRIKLCSPPEKLPRYPKPAYFRNN